MIGIQLEGDDDFLETAPNTAINIRLENPILGEGDKLSPGSYTFPFELPGGNRSPKNSARLKNPDVIENNEAYAIQNARLFFQGVPFKKGTLKAKSTGQDRIPANFLFGLSQISPSFKTAKLRDVVSETINTGAELTKIIYLKKPSENVYGVVINGKSYGPDHPVAGTVTLGVLQSLIYADAIASIDTDKFVPYAELVAVGTSPSGEIDNVYMFIKLRKIVNYYYDEMLEETIYEWEDCTDPTIELSITVDEPALYQVESVDFDSYYDAIDAFMEDYISGDYPSEAIRFPVCFNASPFASGVKEGEVVNALTEDVLVRNDPNWGFFNNQSTVVKNYNSLQPFARLKYILDKIATYFAFEYEGDFYTHEDLGEILLHNTGSIDLAQKYIGEKEFIFWRPSFNVNELVPDIKVVDFFLMIKSRYNLSVDYNETTQKVRLMLREPIATSNQYDDITPMASPVRGNEDERITGYTLRQPKEDKDSLSAEQSFVVGTSEDEFPILCGSILVTGITTINGFSVTGPRVSMLNGEKFGLRVFKYSGIVDGIARATIDDLEDVSSLEELHDTFWKYWLLFKKNRRVITIGVQYPFRMLRNYNWEVKKRFNRLNYLVKSLEFQITNTGIKNCIVELFTMK